MKKKFLSIFVALTLVATMFSTTLVFAEEGSSPEVEFSWVELIEFTGELIVSLRADGDLSNKEVDFIWSSQGEVLGSSTREFWYDSYWGSYAQGTIYDERADSVAIIVKDESGKEIFNRVFTTPRFTSVSDFEIERTATNEAKLSFTSDKAGTLQFQATYVDKDNPDRNPYGWRHIADAGFVAGANEIILPLVDVYILDAIPDLLTDEERTGSIYITFDEEAPYPDVKRFTAYVIGGNKEITIPAFVPTAEETSGVILPSTPDSDKFTWTGEGEASFRLDADLLTFRELYVGDKKNNKTLVEGKDYAKTAGSTIISLKEDYVKTLEDGTYLYTAEFEDGDAILKLIVDTESNGKKSLIPKSGDANRTTGIVVLIASLALAGASFRALRKEQTKA